MRLCNKCQQSISGICNDCIELLKKHDIDYPQEKLKETCNHNFVYSHQEQMSENSMYKKVDVVICTKCGLVIRN